MTILEPNHDHTTRPHHGRIMTTATRTPTTQSPTNNGPTDGPARRMHWNWFGLWTFLTAFAVFEVIKHGYVNGSAVDALALTATAVGFFIAPDLTFLVGAGQPVEKGHISRQAVPWYNAMHRILIPLVLTSVIGIALAPLAFVPLALFIGGLSWMAHIALDRTAGYGLRNTDGSRNRDGSHNRDGDSSHEKA